MAGEAPDGDDEAAATRSATVAAGDVLGALMRRVRRAADLSQRELGEALGVARSTVARAETGDRDLPVSVLARAAELAGLRLGLFDADGREVPGMAPGAVRDRAGRLFPAHLDTRFSDEGWWHGPERYSRERPWYSFDRGRNRRDAVREVIGTPPDHQRPGPGDAPAERARVRTEAAVAARAARWRQEVLQGLRPGRAGDPALTCTCPPACDDLLFPDGPLPTKQLAVPHVDDCACRCDIG